MTGVDLLNQALNYLGEARVQDLTQNTNSAKYGKDSLEPSIKQVLRLHPWNSALKRQKLIRLEEENDFGPRYNYRLPNDYLRLVRFNDGESDYRIEGKNIVTDETTVELLFVAYPDDLGALDAALVEAIASKLAFNIALQVTGSSDMQVKMHDLHEKFLARARVADARESSLDDQSIYAETLRDSPMLQVRRYGRSHYSPTRNRTTSDR